MGYTGITTVYAVIPRPLPRPQVVESLNQDLPVSDSWYLKWHISERLNPKKTKSMVVSWPGYGDLILGGAEAEEILGVT